MSKMRLTRALILVVAGTLAAAAQDLDTASLTWSQQHYRAWLNAIFPLELGDVHDGWNARLRIAPSDGRERLLVIEVGEVAAVRVSVARGHSLFDQLVALRQRNPNADVKELAGHASIETDRFDESTCANLRGMLLAFRRTSVSIGQPLDLSMDPVRFELRSAGFGQELSLAFDVPARAGAGAPALVTASKRLEKGLEGCRVTRSKATPP